ncbi:MAG: DUF1553 domain-containing protein [Acidobacteriota bacterium]
MRFRLISAVLCGTGLWLLASPVAQSQNSPKTDFNRQVRPILSDTCFTCHGPDEGQRMAGLRLDTKEGLFADRGGYQVIVPGKALESKLFQRITARDETRMPPPNAERTLTPDQIEVIRRWIDEGAVWEAHWAYVAPHRVEPPRVRNTSWPKNPIDFFVLSRLEKEGLAPAAEADKATLLRRVTFDLTGLPPTPAEIAAFLADTSPDAYDKVVERLLNSPHYGERMALHWLDLARYSDTHGYHIDSEREMWHWRDWVIGAYNRNLPFNQFTIEQLAGDLLPSPTLDQRIATGFCRNHMINYEGGAIPEEYRTEYVVDRVDTTSTVWMAMTMGCSRCHDHKYDPIKQSDYYRLFAFFNTISEKGLDGVNGNAEPYIQLPSPEQKPVLEKLKQQLTELETDLSDKIIDPLQLEWEQTRLTSLWLPPAEGLLAHYELDGNFSDSLGHHQPGQMLRGELPFVPGIVDKAAEFSGEAHLDWGASGKLDTADPFTISMWVNPNGFKEMVLVQKTDPANRRGIEIAVGDFQPIGDLKRGAPVLVRLTHGWPANGIQVRTKSPLTQSAWTHLAVRYDGSGQAAGVAVFLNNKAVELEVVRDSLSGPIRNESTFETGNQKYSAPFDGLLDDLRVYSRVLADNELEHLAIHTPARFLLKTAPERRSRLMVLDAKFKPREGEERDPESADLEENKEIKEYAVLKDRSARLRDYFLTYDAPASCRKRYAQLKEVRTQKARLDKDMSTAMVMKEMEAPRETHILRRGDYRNKGEKVAPGVPGVLPPLPKDAPKNRLGLAQWLVDPAHPLTARVAVNRYWQMYFGNGIVKTAEDFGSQGEAPVHAELLDWLATEFVRTGWDVKAMQRLIVSSATYRQSSRVSPQLLDKDPENRLLARGPRFRLPAEIVRDNALAVSGLLNKTLGGPGVYPYQPRGLWEEMAYGDVFSAQFYQPSTGADLYRRSLYTFWKRTVPPPSLATFDAPDRERCVARRAVTNTPLQALVLMNDPTFVEAARHLAQQTLRQVGSDPAERIRYAFRLATSREPSAQEIQLLKDLARQELVAFRRDKAAAGKLLEVGDSPPDDKLNASELAAWTMVATTILNLDETITKE